MYIPQKDHLEYQIWFLPSTQYAPHNMGASDLSFWLLLTCILRHNEKHPWKDLSKQSPNAIQTNVIKSRVQRRSHVLTSLINIYQKKNSPINPPKKKPIMFLVLTYQLQNIHPDRNSNEEYYKSSIHFKKVILWEEHYHLKLHDQGNFFNSIISTK